MSSPMDNCPGCSRNRNGFPSWLLLPPALFSCPLCLWFLVLLPTIPSPTSHSPLTASVDQLDSNSINCTSASQSQSCCALPVSSAHSRHHLIPDTHTFASCHHSLTHTSHTSRGQDTARKTGGRSLPLVPTWPSLCQAFLSFIPTFPHSITDFVLTCPVLIFSVHSER